MSHRQARRQTERDMQASGPWKPPVEFKSARARHPYHDAIMARPDSAARDARWRKGVREMRP